MKRQRSRIHREAEGVKVGQRTQTGAKAGALLPWHPPQGEEDSWAGGLEFQVVS